MPYARALRSHAIGVCLQEAASIEIPNITWDVFECMMAYIYTGNVEVNPDLATELLQASDQYLLEGLKRLCEMCIAQSLSVENLAATYELSEAYSAPQVCGVRRWGVGLISLFGFALFGSLGLHSTGVCGGCCIAGLLNTVDCRGLCADQQDRFLHSLQAQRPRVPSYSSK